MTMTTTKNPVQRHLWTMIIAALVATSYLSFLCHGWGPSPSSSSSSSGRRRFLVKSASTASASASAWLLTPSQKEANADPSNALLPIRSGGVVQERPTIQSSSSSSSTTTTPSDASVDWDPSNLLQTELGKTRIGTTNGLSPLQQPVSLPLPGLSSNQEIYYPSLMFGEWNVTSTLRRKIFPFGKDFVPSKSLWEGSPRNRNEQIGDKANYQARFFSTIADTPSNQLTVNLGLGVPETKTIADRAFNIQSMSSGFKQTAVIDTIDWDYRKDPTRLTVNAQLFSTVTNANETGEQKRLLGKQRSEVYLSARKTEDDGNMMSFAFAERSRTVTVGPGNVGANDQEVVTEYTLVPDDGNGGDTVRAISRVAVFLTPNPNSREGILWQQIGGKAVAMYDYELLFRRNRESFELKSEDSEGKVATQTITRPCVQTPKDVVQCQ